MRYLALFLGLLVTGQLLADDMFPKPEWKDAPDPLASEFAVDGGSLNYMPGPEPKSFNGYIDNFSHTGMMFSLMYETLLDGDPLTLDNTPGLANKWSISDDKMTFTFWIDPKAKWSDGKPITAEDVKYTYDAVMACPDAQPYQVALERFDSPTVVDGQTISFRAKEVHWSNLDACGGFPILPKHMLESKLDKAAIAKQMTETRAKMKARAALDDAALTAELRTVLGPDYMDAELAGKTPAEVKAWLDKRREIAAGMVAADNATLFWQTDAGKGVLGNFNFEFPVVSGPYVLLKHDEGRGATFVKRTNWWQKDFLRNQHKLNFKTLNFKFLEDRQNAIESFKKGELDAYAVYTSRYWVEETKGQAFDKNWIVKQRVFNYDAIGFQGFAMNLRKEPYTDRRVRLALYHLLDRERMNDTLMYKQYAMHKSYYEDLFDKEHPCPNEYISYDVDKARALLKDAGWAVNPKTGFLEKGGKEFVVNVLTRDASANRFWSTYEEDLKKVGIQLKITQKDLAAWAKDMDAFNFDMTWAAWGAGTRKDPESMWDSKFASTPSSNNITGYKNPEVDRLIALQKTNFDIQERHDIVRQIDAILAKDVPYLLLWYANYTRLLYWNKFGTPDWVLGKYSGENALLSYWWIDPDYELDLEDAMKSGDALSKRPYDVKFDETFRAPKP